VAVRGVQSEDVSVFWSAGMAGGWFISIRNEGGWDRCERAHGCGWGDRLDKKPLISLSNGGLTSEFLILHVRPIARCRV
jgi:hypothetical protein